MSDAPKTPEGSNVKVIKEFFFPGESAAAVMKEFKALTEEDKVQLGEGIRDGSLTY